MAHESILNQRVRKKANEWQVVLHPKPNVIRAFPALDHLNNIEHETVVFRHLAYEFRILVGPVLPEGPTLSSPNGVSFSFPFPSSLTL
jgi:hypothetical protein